MEERLNASNFESPMIVNWNFSDQNDLWSDHLQTMVQIVVRSIIRPDPVNLVW